MDTLYHSSTNKDLELLEPQRTLSKDIYIGDYVFATSDKRLAAMYLATRGTPILLNTNVKNPQIIISANAKEYVKHDVGGAIYSVPAEYFKKTPQTGLEDSERVSEITVHPSAKTVYESSIAAMREMGVTVYFVSQKQFDEIIRTKNEDHIISKLAPYLQ